MKWLLDPDVREVLEQAERAGFTPSAEQEARYEARAGSGGASGSRVLSVAGENAEIRIEGVMTQRPSWLAMFFGGGNTTYPEIISALAEASQDDSISNITLAVDSPGGQIDGLFEAMDAIKATDKPIKAVVSNLAASAAFGLVSQADTIVAANRAASFGSIGVVQTHTVRDDEVTITSTKAPKKRPDVTTPEGKATVQEDLDGLHDLFAESIAEGRGTTVKKVNTNFGQGATLLAGEALKRGMIDSIAGADLSIVGSTTRATAATSGNKSEGRSMDLQTLKAQHSDVYAAAVEEGVEKERDRVGAHLTMGEASGDMKTACEAIKDGQEMTATLSAKYMAAGMARKDLDAREEDDVQANVVDAPADNKDDKDAFSASVLSGAAELVGVELGVKQDG